MKLIEAVLEIELVLGCLAFSELEELQRPTVVAEVERFELQFLRFTVAQLHV